ncbi:MAG TPA: hypothetical protein VNS81_04590 [Nocardioides sp.]|nr:hypothetical protein [Nocardioides sp.]
MLTVRRTTPRVALPAALTSLETTTALGSAHAVAAGHAPEPTQLVAFGVLVYVASALVLRSRAPIRAALPALLAAQLLGHAWLVALTGAEHAHHGPVLGLSVPMAAAHVAAAAVAGVAWTLRRRAVAVLLQWADGRPLPPAEPGTTLGVTRRRRPRPLFLTSTRPTRGPPSSLVPC